MKHDDRIWLTQMNQRVLFSPLYFTTSISCIQTLPWHAHDLPEETQQVRSLSKPGRAIG